MQKVQFSIKVTEISLSKLLNNRIPAFLIVFSCANCPEVDLEHPLVSELHKRLQLWYQILTALAWIANESIDV